MKIAILSQSKESLKYDFTQHQANKIGDIANV